MELETNQVDTCDLIEEGSSVDGIPIEQNTHHLKTATVDYMSCNTPPERDTSHPTCHDNHKPEDDLVVNDVADDSCKTDNIGGGMAFTIDFGNNQDMPEITDNWKHFAPYKIHSGVIERSEKAKKKLKEKSESLETEPHSRKVNFFPIEMVFHFQIM